MKQVIKLVAHKDYVVWCNGMLVVLRNPRNNSLILQSDTFDLKREFKLSKDKLVGISLRAIH